jgi:hypothetical protein
MKFDCEKKKDETYVEVDLVTVDGTVDTHPVFHRSVEAANRDNKGRDVEDR